MSEEQAQDQSQDTGQDQSQSQDTGTAGTAELGQLRELVLAAHADVVPEMVTGANLSELMASVEPARAAYARIAGQFSQAGSEDGGASGAAFSGATGADRDSGNRSDALAGDAAHRTSGQSQGATSPPAVASQPAGRQTFVINVEELSPGAKIAEGLKRLR